jgi:photosystem I P700 chlorophyll a apoprotein A1
MRFHKFSSPNKEKINGNKLNRPSRKKRANFVEKTQSKLVLKMGTTRSFSRTLAKVKTTRIWNLHADAHDFDSQTSSLEEVSRKIFSAHFGQLVIFLWISGMHFHGAYFSNYSAWLNDPVNIKQSSQVVWPIVGQEILNGDVGGNFQGIQTTSGVPNVACRRYH